MRLLRRKPLRKSELRADLEGVWIERLECRQFLSTSSPRVAEPALSARPEISTAAIDGFIPSEIQHAYGFDQLSFGNGVAGDGSGQTIAIVDAYDHPRSFPI